VINQYNVLEHSTMYSDVDKRNYWTYENRLTIIKERTRQVARFAKGDKQGALTGFLSPRQGSDRLEQPKAHAG